jgi:hypothetical protein
VINWLLGDLLQKLIFHLLGDLLQKNIIFFFWGIYCRKLSNVVISWFLGDLLQKLIFHSLGDLQQKILFSSDLVKSLVLVTCHFVHINFGFTLKPLSFSNPGVEPSALAL